MAKERAQPYYIPRCSALLDARVINAARQSLFSAMVPTPISCTTWGAVPLVP